ncbi:hypothetical protein AALO_G00006230 [Alosa alosa]|uniref:DUF4585 domain-containing protein n=1 Tax=Alosa alosa TaxID=278164 RepID=A0AAV6HF06_9TELE|nr:uncharacterized protein C4orf54 homolog [Alosa alosa]KAG5285685.1 hypothetical protein AALO_G00006230 [Alosa alosa]
METLQTNISHIGETASYKKSQTEENKQKSIDSQPEESNYVDLNNLLDMTSDGTKTVKVTFTGEGNQLAIFKCQSDTSTVGDGSPGKRKEKGNITETPSKDCHQDHSKDARVGQRDSVNSSPTLDDEISIADMPTTETDPQTDLILQDYNPQNVSCESEELRYTDMYLNSQSESEDGSSSVVLSDQCTLNTFADESHYITTHEIQLTELDHDVDYEIGRGPCWDYEDTNLVYSFVDYASFESDETTEGTLVMDRRIGKAKITKAHSVNAGQCGTGETAVSTESDVCECDSDKCVSSDESVCKNPNGGESSSGQIHLSIKTSSRNINESNNFLQNENISYHARRTGERSQYFFRGSDSSREALFDRAHYFIPAPGRQHLAPQLKGKDINEYSSGASSSVSELDDADKEVRNLTAKSFRSLACPYFDAINLSTSSESSFSSTLMDLNYGNMAQGHEKRLISHRSSTFELNKNAQCKTINGVANLKVPQAKTCSHNKNKPSRSNIQNDSSASKQIEIRGQYDNQGQGEMITLTETLNFSCNVEAGLPTRKRRAKCVENTAGSRSADEVTSIMPSRPGSEAASPHIDCGDAMEDTHKKAIFASSLLKNVISKKMQFEQERKMERGEIRDTHPVQSPCFQIKDPDTSKEPFQCEVLQRQTSETDSGLIALNELGDVVETSSNIDPREQHEQRATVSTADSTPDCHPDDGACKSNKDMCESKKVQLAQSQNSAFKSWKDGELSVDMESGNDREENIIETSSPTSEVSVQKESQSVSAKSTKMSHLYVPSSQLLSKDREGEQQTQSKNIHDAVMEQGEGECECRDNNSSNLLSAKDTSAISQAKKAPEIKIRLRSVKENKKNPFNIASLLTPKIGFSTTYPPKPASESKCQVLSQSEKVPHFTVRDIRETKGKFQTPIHQVRDVRKLVKSSYRFVSLENTENKAATSASLLREDKVGIFKKEPDKKPSQSPIVIKCHSVNTNNLSKPRSMAEASKRGQTECATESDRLSPKHLSDCIKNESVFANRSMGRTPCVKTPYSDQTESKMETKAAKQRQDKTIENMEKKSESKATNQAALEKLKAAVKTMEQLYVFDRNEWKRKTQAPRPVTDSHVLSLITSEEQGGPSKTESEDDLGKGTEIERPVSSIINPPVLASTLQTGVAQSTEDKVNLKSATFSQEDTSTSKTSSVHGQRFNNKCVFNFASSLKAPASSGPAKISVRQTLSVPQGVSTSKAIAPKFPKTPLSLKITPPKREAEEKGPAKSSETFLQAQPIKPAPAETENYLTIPVRACTTDTPASSAAISASGKPGPSTASSHLGASSHSQQQALQRSPIIMESWAPDSPTSTTIYHHSLPIPLTTTGPQVLCISPSLVPSVAEPMQQQQTQKKMLLDPTTGHYYLVDTPVQPATKRLYDPETGQYVDVPVPPPQPLTPVPMPMSPLALSPGTAFAPTYMIYPSLMASPTAFTTHSLSSSTQSEGDGERAQGKDSGLRAGVGVGSPSGTHPSDHSRGVGGISVGPGGKPVISITTQQGPRIIAPPSFDGTTMSFVVEHR